MGGAPEVEAWAEGGGYKVTVYREAKDGASYRKIKEYGEESGKRAGILWMKRKVYAPMCEKEEEVEGSAARGEGHNGYGRGAPARAIVVGSNREQSLTSNDSRPSTCGAESVGSAEGTNLEQQRKAAWAWKRRGMPWRGHENRCRTGWLWGTWTAGMWNPYGQSCARWRAGRILKKS